MKRIIKLIVGVMFIIPFNVKAIDTSAKSAILMDIDSKRIFYSKNIHAKQSVASISKIMTCIVAIESGKLDENVVIGDEIDSAYGSGIYIQKGEKLKLIDLLYGLMLRSGNDAALAIANYVGGSKEKFVEIMNEKASLLGMKDTVFNNPSGLDEKEEKGNFSTAYDMAILTSYAYKNDTFKEIIKTQKYKLTTNKNTYSWTNKNKLLKMYKYATGGKTGFTKIAKRTLVNTASKNNLNLVVVTLNDGNDFNDHKDLFEYAFNTYESYEILKKGNIEIEEDEYYKDYNLYIKNSFSYPLDNIEKNNVSIKYELEKVRTKSNKKVGKVKVYLYDDIIHEEDIFVKEKEKKEKISFGKKIWKWICSIW